jgi:hypothetical protein
VVRPTGVTVIGILGIVMAIWTILSLFLPSSRAFLAASFASDRGAIVGLTVLVGALAITVLLAVAGMGILRLKTWARILSMIISALYMLMYLAEILSGPEAYSRSDRYFFYFESLIAIAVSGLILWYLFRPTVRLVFDKTKITLPVQK